MTNSSRCLLVLSLVSLAACDSPGPSELDPAIRALLSGPLAVGDVESFTGESASRITVDGGLEGSDYLLVVSHTSTVGDAVADVTVEGEGLVAGSGTTNADRQASLQVEADDWAQELPDDGGFHRWHLERERELVRQMVGGLPQGGRSFLLEAAPTLQAVPSIGDVIQVNVNSAAPCENPDFQDARVEAVSDQAIVVSDVRNPSGGLTAADFALIAQEFDDKVFPLSTANFGEPAREIGPARTTILYSVAVNELGSDFGLIVGFFFSRDLFPRTAQDGLQGCEGSNEREMFYMLAPDPQGEFSDPVTLDDIRGRTLNTIMHEHQHLINASRRLYVSGAGSFEAVWLNEALSHVGEELLFYQESGMSPRQNITVEDVRANEQRLAAVNIYQIQNLVRYTRYLSDPPAASPVSPDDGLEMRGAAWSFLRYVVDQYSDNDADFLQSLVSTTDVGVDNLENRIGRDLDGPLYRWNVSNYADDLVPGVDGSFRQPSWDFRSMIPAINDDQFPLAAENLRSGETISASIHGGSSTFIRFSVPGGSRVTLNTRSGGGTPPITVRNTIVRLR